MKRLVLKLVPLIIVYLKLSESVTNSEPVTVHASQNQCIKIASFLKNVFASNNVTREGLVNVAIADYSVVMDTNCIIHELQNTDDRIVFYGVTYRQHIHSKIIADYFIFFEEFSEKSTLLKVKPNSDINPTVKFIFVTYYNTVNEYVTHNEKYTRQVYLFIINKLYQNGLIIGVFEQYFSSFSFAKLVRKFQFRPSKYEILNPINTLESLSVIYYDNQPFSYRNGSNKIVGVEGNVIDEFCTRFNLTYEIIHAGKGLEFMPTDFDISLFRRIRQGPDDNFDKITINDAGSNQCFLVPRNIPVYSSRFSVPFDKFVNVLFLVSVLSITVLWKVIKIYRKQKISLSKLFTSVLKCVIGYPLPVNLSCIRWSIKERLFLIPFVFVCFILLDLFTSFMISSLMVELPMRSVQSLQELNDSDLMIYEYYSKNVVDAQYRLMNRILHVVNRGEVLTHPSYFDQNLASIINCKFGEVFIKSSRNFDNNQPIFDLLRDYYHAFPYATYLVQSNFPLKNEFINMVSSLQESGIIEYWSDHFIRESFPNHSMDDNQNAITLSAIQLPIVILITGLCVSVAAFLIEWIYFNYISWKQCQVIDLREDREIREKWRRLFELLHIKRCRKQKKMKVLQRQRTVYMD